MLAYVIRRTIGSVPTLFALTAITFFMMRIAPGGPVLGQPQDHPGRPRQHRDAPITWTSRCGCSSPAISGACCISISAPR